MILLNLYILFIHENIFPPNTPEEDLKELSYENNNKVFENISLILSEQKLIMKNINSLSNRVDYLELSVSEDKINTDQLASIGVSETKIETMINNGELAGSIQSKATLSNSSSYQESQKEAYELLKDLNMPD